MSLSEKLSNIEGLQYNEAIARMCGDEELYRSALELSSQQIPSIIAELDGQLDGGDMAGFAISVHGLKGALNTIGAVVLAGFADSLCKSARSGDDGAVSECWKEFRPQLESFVDKISTL